MVINKEVGVVWGYRNKTYYINKGYKYTQNGNIFIVKVEDLTDNNSKVFVDVECDGCGKKIEHITWQSYIRGLYKDGKYYCSPCAHNGHSKFVSFYDWCVKNDRQDLIDRWDEKLNKYTIKDIPSMTENKYYFKCPEGIHDSELNRISDITTFHNINVKCKKCNSFAVYLINSYGEDALKTYWDYNKNDKLNLNPWNISKSNKKKVWIICQKHKHHGSYPISTFNFINGERCPYCNSFASGKVHRLDSIGCLFPQVLEIWSDKNTKTPYEYSPMSMDFIWFKCLDGKHEDYYRRIEGSTKSDYRCPECVRERDESFLQEKTRLYLNKLGYLVLHERNCTLIPVNPKNNYQLPFDNEIIIDGKKLIIEVHGEQHYQISIWQKRLAKLNNTTPEYELHMQQVRDRYKRFIAYKCGYEYIAIPYWTDNKRKTYKQLINNKIEYILLKEVS